MSLRYAITVTETFRDGAFHRIPIRVASPLRPQSARARFPRMSTKLRTQLRRIVATALALIPLVALLTPFTVAHTQGAPTTWDAYAVRYATLPQFKVSGLIAGADTSRRLDIAMMVWLLKGPGGRNVVVDAGFTRDDLIARWKPTGFLRPDSAVALAGVAASQVTDVIVSHIHWDHFDGAALFPNARIWVQREEVDHHIDSTGKRINTTIDAPDAAMLHALRTAGRLRLVDGDAKEVIPGITVYTGGKHTFASQYASVRLTGGSTAVIASDNVYLYENLTQHRPIAQTLDSLSNVAQHARMRALAAERLIVPGHDPAVMERFERVGERVVRIR